MKTRAFVRYSKKGKVVPGSLILTGGSFPQGSSTWKEVPADLCAGPIINSADSGTLASFPWIGAPNIVVYCNTTGSTYTYTQIPYNLLPQSIEELVRMLNEYVSIYGVFSVSPDGTSIILNVSAELNKTLKECPCDLSFEVFPASPL